MKIICQACQSKYTIADDKIQGKVAKIRCRTCGATVLIDGSAPGGGPTEGSAAPSATPTAAAPWLVNVADGDQKPMSTQEIVEAYNAREVTTDTYVWKDGFSDWRPIGQIHEIVDALTSAMRAATPAAAAPQAGGYQAPAEAARREAPRGAGGDLFTGGAKDDGVVASAAAQQAAPPAAGAKGAAGEESSNIFSLGALTSSADAPFVPVSPAVKGKEDSGVIDLNALAKAQAAAAQQAAAPKPAAPQFLFPAALGQVQPPAPVFDIPEPPRRSSMPKVVAIGVVIAVGLVGVLLFATHKEEPPPPPVASVAPAPPEPPPPPTASEAPPAESAAPVASARPTKKYVPRGTKRTSSETGVSVPTVPAAGPKRGPCGCAPGDMQCNIRCSATGK